MGSKLKPNLAGSRGVFLLLSKPILFAIAALMLVSGNSVAWADSPSTELDQLLPDQMGSFRRSRPVDAPKSLAPYNEMLDGTAVPKSELSARTEYITSNGERFFVELVRFSQDSEAYSLLSVVAQGVRTKEPPEKIEIGSSNGTAGFVTLGQIAFFKGRHFVRVLSVGPRPDSRSLATLADLLAERLDKSEGEIPVLIKHLPNWEQAQKSVAYISRFTHLGQVVQFQPVLNAVSTEGDGDAVVAKYGSTQLLLIEFNTPQLASDNDQRILNRIQELRNQAKPLPSGYRRVGNYAVFVFNAPNEQAAKELIDQVKYEQVVQWLGENPNILKEAERRYVETTLGVFLSVVKASGLAALGCLAVGGFLGVLLFTRRRAHQKAVEAFSDAGGMVRLNIDELSAETNPARLIGEGN